MKFNFWSFQFLIVFVFLLISCSSSTEEIIALNPSSEEKYIQVPIGFSGEITNVTESPLTRIDGVKDWYAFQVYAKPESDPDGYYQYYAYGFFDNKEDMTINLKAGYKYMFDVSMVVSGSERVHCFCLTKSGWAQIGNSFFISSEESVRYMHEGYLYCIGGQFKRPSVDRFFGRTEDYTPTEGGSVSINMKRVSFGVKFVANNFTNGNLEISVEWTPTINLDASERNETQEIISFDRLSTAYFSEEEYAEDIPVNIVWVKPDNTRVPIASQIIAFKRNKLTTIEFEISENTIGNSFVLVANETIESGETLQIGGDGINTGVDPMD